MFSHLSTKKQTTTSTTKTYTAKVVLPTMSPWSSQSSLQTSSSGKSYTKVPLGPAQMLDDDNVSWGPPSKKQ
ncbi:hypothetical protein PC9H_005607 [Pleurotus ostreatus]|uniref:Uncharacterized protein n=1 Tax=Pleurotus ostreatus TaxID=5322 RepID=A0A8H6ZZA3_PLEOS|nr:uncharacterized protein PC9H_005607 [Pleurotus ostreatus]KAF7433646.1 hypothetical protein PC9H_005607 [Pleurotus ostreatus]